MAEMIDILMPKLNQSPDFVVDTTGPNYVDVNPPLAPIMDLYSADVTKLHFRNGDNIVILSMGYFLPDNFITYEMALGSPAVPSWRLYGYRETSGLSVALSQFGANGIIRAPFPNFEMSFGIFLDTASVLGEPFHLQIELSDAGRISMIGAPAILNGEKFHVVPFIKVLHNFSIT
jgi:hypothetical protein